MESIQLKQDNLLKIGIKNAEGKDTYGYSILVFQPAGVHIEISGKRIGLEF